MPGIHRYRTIAFRPTAWEREQIEKRCELSGMLKKDFIIQSCIHSKIVVAGTRERVQRIIGEVQEMQDVMKDVAGQIMSGNITLSEESFQEMKEEYLALTLAVVDIVNGAAYLFEEDDSEKSLKWKEIKEIEQLKEALDRQRDTDADETYKDS